ncbi:MAG: hypothetical protein R3B60_01455 [Candidatus Paceibacterota bacterium]
MNKHNRQVTFKFGRNETIDPAQRRVKDIIKAVNSRNRKRKETEQKT